LIPVAKSFTQNDFLSLSVRRFSSDSGAINIQAVDSPYFRASSSNIYFVQINIDKLKSQTLYYEISGLFDGNVWDSIQVTKGGFDFEINSQNLNF